MTNEPSDDRSALCADEEPSGWADVVFGIGYLGFALFCQWLVIHMVIAWELLPIGEGLTYGATSLVVAVIEIAGFIHLHVIKKSGDPWNVVVLQALTWYGQILLYLGMVASIPLMMFGGFKGLVLLYHSISANDTGEVTAAVRYNVAFIFLIATAVLMMYLRNRKKNPGLAKVNQFALTAAALAAVLAVVFLSMYS